MNVTSSREADALTKGDTFVVRKRGKSSTVGVIKGEAVGHGCDVWVKRVHVRGVLDRILKSLVGSRARKLWDISRALREKGLPVPEPLGYLEPAPWGGDGYFFSEAISDNENLHHFFLREGRTPGAVFTAALARAVAAWHVAGAVHGDLKWTNILVRKSADEITFFFVDLDQAELHKVPNPLEISRDLTRFYRAGLELEARPWVDEEFLPAYLSCLPDDIRAALDMEAIRETAVREWKKKGMVRYTATP